MKNKNIPAFPIADPFIAMKPQTEEEAKQLQGGMTLRDYFAAKALYFCLKNCFTTEGAVEDAYVIADAMLKTRNN